MFPDLFWGLLILLQPNLIWWHIIISWSVLWKGCFSVFKFEITTKVQSFVELEVQMISSEWCNLLKLNLYGEASSSINVNLYMGHKNFAQTFACSMSRRSYTAWAVHVMLKNVLLSSRSSSQWGPLESDMTIYSVSSELLILLQPNLIWWCIIISLVKRFNCCVQGTLI